MIPFLIASLIVGVVVVFFLPYVRGIVEQNTMVAGWVGNPFVQVILVGAIVMVGIWIFTSVARQLKLSPAKI